MEKITGTVSKLDTHVLSELFPDYDVNLLQRQSNTVDILLGCDYFRLHPKTEVFLKLVHLSIMSGEFGVCLQGTHSSLKEDTRLDCNLAKTVHDNKILKESNHSTFHLFFHHEFVSPSHQPADVSYEMPYLNSSVNSRGHTPNQLRNESEWWNGPSILYRPEEEWVLQFDLQQDVSLPGERKLCSTAATQANHQFIDFNRFSSITTIVWIVARLQNIVIHKSFKGGHRSKVTPEDLRKAEDFMVKVVQSTIAEELQKVNTKSGIGGRYSRLNTAKGPDGIWVVGKRMQKYNAMTADSGLQMLLPKNHNGTKLFMRRAHESGHRGRIATLAKFRQHFWVPHGDKLARSITNSCQLCKIREPILLKQEMGILPATRLKPSSPFNHVMLDLFGPYTVRGEVQKRTSTKLRKMSLKLRVGITNQYAVISL